MASLSRSPSVLSFASAESMSMPTTPSTPGSPVLLPERKDEAFMPRSSTLNRDRSLTVEATKHRFYLRDGNAKFEVRLLYLRVFLSSSCFRQLKDGTLYNVHQYLFETHSPKFAAAYFAIPQHEAIKLPQDVSSTDFERLLSMFYPSELGKTDIQTADEWTSILRLSTKWSIVGLRTLSIHEIEAKASDVEKVAVAREFNLGPSWLVPAFTEICTAPKWLAYADAQCLGLCTVVEVGRIREEQRLASDRKTVYDVRAAVSANSTLMSQDADVSGMMAPLVDAMAAVRLQAESATDSQSLGLQQPGGARKQSAGDTALDRALHALEILDRIANEIESPKTMSRSDWRQQYVDDIARELKPSEQGNEVTTPAGCTCVDCLEVVTIRMAQLVFNHFSGTSGSNALVIVFDSRGMKDWMKAELERRDLLVANVAHKSTSIAVSRIGSGRTCKD
ncbi:hypothetical protein BD626DRAFT_2612 [Schizophyllum amplum]|uniref:BTB domain-containing protein n=1 Tax=Schizophyllum amplum TaxID=97359 RepID=A0A550CVW0_9AGAR|nr:hypothetical protein BD626DRAFT_2612 [Auriculariopsis ampla]